MLINGILSPMDLLKEFEKQTMPWQIDTNYIIFRNADSFKKIPKNQNLWKEMFVYSGIFF
jgi:hypothetical protein